jgi:MFS transporter, ACS family, D-galactonate transporter
MIPIRSIASPAPLETRMSRSQWLILILLVLSAFINYVDRGNLSVAAPVLKTELNLSTERLGFLLSSFFWTYAAFQLFGIAGWLVDRFDVALLYAAGFFLWSVVTAVSGVATTFSELVALRLLLGMGESIAYPCISKMVAANFSECHRGFVNALIDAGSKCGPALGTFTGGLVIARFGWRPFFVALGLVTLIWLLPWGVWMPREGGPGAVRRRDCVPSGRILRHRRALFSFAGLFCVNYYWYFLVTWLPLYLVMDRKFPTERMATFGALCYLAIAITTTISGYVSDRWIASGGSPTKVRKTFAVTGLIVSTMILPVAIVHNLTLAQALLLISCMGYGAFSSNHWAIMQTLSGPAAAGKWTAFQNGFASLAGVAAPWLTGWLVQHTGSFFPAFFVAGAVVLTGAAIYLWGIGPVRELDWTRR